MFLRLVTLTLAALTFSDCGSTRFSCDATSCPAGCCSETGRCELGTTLSACGAGGSTCSACTAEEACTEGACGVDVERTATVTWHGHVVALTQRHCVGCHVTDGIAPFSLERYQDAKPMAQAIKAAVVSRRMPPYLADPSCGGPFVDEQRLTPAEIATITAWVDQGAARGDPTAAVPAAATLPKLATVDASLTMAEPYTPAAASTDDYRCFLLNPALPAARFVTGYDIVPGVAAEVHHVIVYIVDRAAAATRDAAAPGPGWTCYGDSGIRDSPGPVGAWAPGVGAVVYPAGTGVQLQPSQALAMQIHYNTRAGVRSPDQTSIRLMYAPTGVGITGAYLLPLVADGFAIPPKATDYQHRKTFNNPVPISIKIWGLMPHMHTLGKRLSIRGPENECLVDIPEWDFHWQRQYFRRQPFTVAVGKSVSLSCAWENPSNRTIRWGESTDDEMCFAYVYATP